MELSILITLIVVGVVILLAITFLVVLKIKKGKKPKIIIDDEFITNIFTLLGSKENVKAISVDNSRLKFEVIDLKKVNLNGLKEFSQNGVFVTNNVVKTLFKYDSAEIKRQMERSL